ncbi:MAG: ABC transporter ATP-binding protein, partial [Chloroflexi bacterium]|nr:ABC transporter ATP-binding protein [Chloroflexota bacterium]
MASSDRRKRISSAAMGRSWRDRSDRSRRHRSTRNWPPLSRSEHGEQSTCDPGRYLRSPRTGVRAARAQSTIERGILAAGTRHIHHPRVDHRHLDIPGRPDLSVHQPAVELRGLRKSYGSTEAVRGIDLRVERGEVFALLGPNGAGKTTTVEILEGHRSRSGGEVSVLGHDPGRNERALKERLGIVLQQTGVDEYLTVREVVRMVAGYYPRPRDVEDVLMLTGLGDQADRRVKKLSGGQKRRVDLAVALAGDPELLFLDEPTTGLDPSARRQAWETIRGLASLGKT